LFGTTPLKVQNDKNARNLTRMAPPGYTYAHGRPGARGHHVGDPCCKRLSKL